jgi:tripartite-type tricarboxylate transporter receptor subunit TctC
MKTHTHIISRRQAALTVGALTVAAAGLSAVPCAFAQSDRPVRFILPNATRSGVDASGAGGVVGLQALARSAPDGYTLSVVSNNVVIFPSVIKSLPFDMPGDFTPIAVVGATPMVLVVNPTKVPATNSKEFVALLKSKPGALNFASGGNGTILHLATELFLEEAGVTAKHIPYKGVGPMVTDLIGGQVEFGTAALPSVQAHIRSGALRPIGMLTAQRSAAAPDIPTFAEQGLTNFVVDAWFAVIGPKGMSPAAVKKAHDAVVAAFSDPAVKEAMAKQGNAIHISTPEQAQATFRSELAKYAALVKKAGIEPQ